MREREWVQTFCDRVAPELSRRCGQNLSSQAGRRLSYSTEVHEYTGSDRSDIDSASYETDLMVCEERPEGRWVPRVVIECKLGSVTTHDVLTYAAKAATHRNVHPYLRYGMLLGARESHAIPGRAVRHGGEFDFLASWQGEEANAEEWKAFVDLLCDEVRASQTIQELMRDSRSPQRTRFTILHRKLTLS